MKKPPIRKIAPRDVMTKSGLIRGGALLDIAFHLFHDYVVSDNDFTFSKNGFDNLSNWYLFNFCLGSEN